MKKTKSSDLLCSPGTPGDPKDPGDPKEPGDPGDPVDPGQAMMRIATPIIAISAVLGLAPVKPYRPSNVLVHSKEVSVKDPVLERRGRSLPLSRSIILELYSVIILAGMATISYSVFQASGKQSLRPSSLVGVLVHSSALFTALVVVVVYVATIGNTRASIQSLAGLLDCERDTGTITPERLRKARQWVAAQLAMWVLVSTLFAVYHFEIEDPHSNAPLAFCYRAYSLARPFMHLSCIQFGNVAHALSMQLESVNDSLLELLGPVSAGLTLDMVDRWSKLGGSSNPLRQPGLDAKVEESHLETVRELRRLHHRMHLVAVSVQAAFGPQMLLVLLSSLLDYTTVLYILLGHIDHDIVGFTIGTIHIIVTLLVLTAGNRVRQEAQRMGEILQRGLVHLRLGQRLVDELQSFSQQLIRLPTRLSACGLMNLDYTMIQGAVGTVTTYLVIMLQFPGSGSSEFAKAKAAAVAAAVAAATANITAMQASG